MKIFPDKIWAAMVQTVRQFPVETGIILYGFTATALFKEDVLTLHTANLKLIPLFFALAFIFNQLTVNNKARWIYYLCWIPVVPLWLIDPEAWVESMAYMVSIVICVFGVFACRRKSDNRTFASEVARYLFNALVAVGFAGVAYLLLSAIYYSVRYIFNVFQDCESSFMTYSAMAAFIIAAPLMFLTFTRNNLSREIPANRMIDTLFNYIITPALLIYTAILYLYFAKITATWSLPKGKLAYMVFAFTILAMAVKACQPLLERRVYDWYFRYFSFIAIPAVAMFWIGSMHRVVEYGFTEERIYLLVCGLIMTVALSMFLFRGAGRYLHVAVVAIGLLCLFTYIPPFSAKNLAIRSQNARVHSTAVSIGLMDGTGKFIREQRPLSDTVYRREYRRIYESLQYLNGRNAPLFGLKNPEELVELLPEGIRAYVAYGTEDGSFKKYIYLNRMGVGFDIGENTRLYLIDKGQSVRERTYHYEIADQTLKLLIADEVLWSASFDELMDMQLRKIGYSKAAPPDEETIQAHRSDLLMLHTGSFRLIFSNMVFIRESGELTIREVTPEVLLIPADGND